MNSDGVVMEGSNSLNRRGEEAKTWDEMYSIDLMPSELFLKFREQIHGYRLGLNLKGVQVDWYRIFTKRQKSKPNRTKPNMDLERARKTEAKGTKGLQKKLKRKLPDRLDKVCAFNEDKTKSKSTPGYGVGKSIEN
ncbi:hypothetical protein Tco_1296095, partial [Tanacetum coccineum]